MLGEEYRPLSSSIIITIIIISGDRNAIKKEAKKILKYKDLAI